MSEIVRLGSPLEKHDSLPCKRMFSYPQGFFSDFPASEFFNPTSVCANNP
jgi:hypothetical protein